MATSISSFLTLCQYVAKENEQECQEEQYAPCPHCDLWLCSPHNLEHQQILQADASALNDRANQVRQQLTALSIDYLYGDNRKKIDEWLHQMHTEINARHAEMLQQLTKLHNERTKEVNEFKAKKIEFFSQEIAEPLTHMLTKRKQVHPEKLKIIQGKVESLERKIEDIKHLDLIYMNCDEIKLNGVANSIRKHPCDEIEETLKHHPLLNLDIVKQKPADHFPLNNDGVALAASTHFILVYHHPSALLLFNTETQLRSIDTKENIVYDICWSNTMKLFLLSGNKLQTYDIISNNLVDSPIDDLSNGTETRSVTSYMRDIFLLFNTGMMARYSWPSFARKVKWSSNDYLENDSDFGAACIRISITGILAISIKEKDLQRRIDLFDAQMQRIHRGDPLTNIGTADGWFFHFTSLSNDEWLVKDRHSEPQTLSLIDKNGKLKQQVEAKGNNIVLMGKTFIVLRDYTALYLYELPQEA